MATQANAKTIAGLLAQTAAALEGVRAVGANPDVNVQDMEAILESGLTIASEAIEATANAKAEQGQKRYALQQATKGLVGFVKNSMTLFKLTFGDRWNSSWEVLKLPVGSVAVPRKRDNVLLTAKLVQDYLAANAAMESQALGVTAANAAAKIAAVEVARNGVNAATATVRNCISREAETAKLLGRNLRVLRDRLEVMGPEDFRWLNFGYSRPCDPNTPEVPSDVTAVKVGETLAVSWSPARRAERYKVYVLEKGVDQDAQLRATTSETETYLSGLKADARYEITVTAVNKAGESQSDTPMEVTF